MTILIIDLYYQNPINYSKTYIWMSFNNGKDFRQNNH